MTDIIRNEPITDINSDIRNLTLIPEGIAGDVTFELTSRCNARCNYCSVPHSPSYGAQDMTQQRINLLKKLLDDQRVNGISLSGRGEITYIENWVELIEEFKELAWPTHTVSNLSKPLSWEEAQALAKLDCLSISIDTVDNDLSKKIRKGIDLRNVLSNVSMIRAAAIEQGKPDLNLQIIAVMNVSTIFGVKKLASLAVSLRASSLTLQDLVMDYSKQVESVDIRHISTLPPARILEAVKELIEAKQIAEAHGCSFIVRQGIYDTITDAMQALEGAETRSFVTVEMDLPHLGRHLRSCTPVKEGETRNCLMPWHLTVLLADGGIEVCCGGIGSIGSYLQAEKFSDVSNHPGVLALRESLLAGKLNDMCYFCGTAPAMPIAEFQDRIRSYMDHLADVARPRALDTE